MRNNNDTVTILVVDDEYTTHRIVKVILNNKTYDIISAFNGLEALEQLSQHPVDMILTDVNMPYMDGIALVERVRSDTRYQDLPIVIISASPHARLPEEALAKGANAFISQPFSSWELNQVVSNCLAPSSHINGQPVV